LLQKSKTVYVTNPNLMFGHVVVGHYILFTMRYLLKIFVGNIDCLVRGRQLWLGFKFSRTGRLWWDMEENLSGK